MFGADDADLIGSIYGTVEADDAWCPLLDRFRAELGVQSAVAQILEEQPDRLEIAWNARDSLSHSRSAVHDRWATSDDNPRLRLRPDAVTHRGEIGSDQRLYGRDPKAIEDLRQGLGKIGLGQGFWAGFEISPGRHFSVIMHRAAGDDRDVSEAEEGLLANLLPHFKRSLRLGSMRRVDMQRATAFQAALDLLSVPTLLCNPDLGVHWANAAALECLGTSDVLKISGGKLQALSEPDRKRLRAFVAQAAMGNVAGTVENFISGSGRSHQLRATAAPTAVGQQGEQVIICLSDSNSVSQFDPCEIMKVFGLTPAEARLAAAIAGGTSVSDYATLRGVAVGTARIQLKQVLAKTGTNRQAELVRELNGSILARTRLRSH